MNTEKIHRVEENVDSCPICGGKTFCIPSRQQGKMIYLCIDNIEEIISSEKDENREDRTNRYYFCTMELLRQKRSSLIRVQGTNANEVQTVSLALIEKTKEPPHTSLNPWVSGSFYLIVFVVVLVALAVVGRLLPIVVLPLILIGGILAMSVIGALQLRQDDRLNEENFLKLMALSFKYLPWIRKRDITKGQ